MNDMFILSLVAIPVCIAFGSIAVVWALQSRIVGSNKATSCPFTPVAAPLSKITSQPKMKRLSFVRERLFRLMMIFERSVVNCFSSFRVNSSPLNTRVSLFTAMWYFCSSQSRSSQFLILLKIILFSTLGYLLHGRTEMQLVPQTIREQSKQYQ